MLRKDFISKIIEQMLNAIARLMKIDNEKETEKFLGVFDEILKTYYDLHSDEMDNLLLPDEKRDAMLLDEKLKNFQLRMFVQAGFAYLKTDDLKQAKNCLSIIERIQHEHSDVFEFPTEEHKKLKEDIEKLREKLG